jgi:hypothetical protein
MSKPDRAAMLDRAHEALSVRRQCVLLGLARSGVYRARPAANDDGEAGLIGGSTSCSRRTRSWARGGWRRCCGTRAVSSTASGFSG